jgi:16S rRNA C967 or C1407 C5-methylase (RsmB/RsmF family)/NOL1/NOP2/fmu family ribosome biogenesis protein
VGTAAFCREFAYFLRFSSVLLEARFEVELLEERLLVLLEQLLERFCALLARLLVELEERFCVLLLSFALRAIIKNSFRGGGFSRQLLVFPTLRKFIQNLRKRGYIVPNYFEQREQELLGTRFEELYRHTGPEAARGVTVNTLRCTPEWFAQNCGFAVQQSSFCQNGFLVEDAGFHPGWYPYHHAGAFYSQEPSASAPVPLMKISPGMRVLDMCAAPGGKSSQIAAALQGQGLLVSNEIEPARAEVLRRNLERMGTVNAVVANEQPNRIAVAFPGWFDRVLVDAPCSGEGMFRKEPAAIAQHSEALVEHCAALGKKILEAAAMTLAPGGELTYSTCTFSPQEDEAQIGIFLAAHPEFSLCDLSNLPFGRPGEQNRAGTMNYPACFCRRIWPADGGEGHFMARLKKAGEISSASSFGSEKKTEKQHQSTLWQEFARQYFPGLAGKPTLELKEMTLLPPELALPRNHLHILRAGVLAGSTARGRFEPAHALFMAYGAQCTNRERLLRQDPRTAAWLRGEEIPADTAQNGWCSVLVDGLPMGFGKASGGKIKNHYPKALRNLK